MTAVNCADSQFYDSVVRMAVLELLWPDDEKYYCSDDMSPPALMCILLFLPSAALPLDLKQCSNALFKTFPVEFLQHSIIVYAITNSMLKNHSYKDFIEDQRRGNFQMTSSFILTEDFYRRPESKNSSTHHLITDLSAMHIFCVDNATDLDLFLDAHSSKIVPENELPLRDRRTIRLWITEYDKLTQLTERIHHFPNVLQQDSLNFVIQLAAPDDFLTPDPGGGLQYFDIYQIRKKTNVLAPFISDGSNILATVKRRMNMHKVFYTMSYQTHKDYVPWVKADEQQQIDRQVIAGYNFVSSLVQTLNITYRIIKGTGFISLNPNGTLGGMGDQIVNYVADYSLNQNELVMYRAKALSYTQPILLNEGEVFFEQPTPSSVKNILTEPFTFSVWVCIGSLEVVIAVAWASVALVWLSCEASSDAAFHSAAVEAIANAPLMAINVLCLQGWSRRVPKWSLRIIVLSGALLGNMLYIFYSTYILAVFAVDPIKFQSLFDFPSYGYGLISQSRSLTGGEILDQLSMEMFNRKGGMPSVDMENAINQVRSKKMALVTTPNYFFSTATNFSERELCKLRSRVRVPALTDRSVLYFRKNDPLRTFYNYEIIAMIERGFIHRTQHEINELMQRPCDQRSTVLQLLSVEDVISAFYILCAAACLSFSILLIERLFAARQNIQKFSFSQ